MKNIFNHSILKTFSYIVIYLYCRLEYKVFQCDLNVYIKYSIIFQITTEISIVFRDRDSGKINNY